MGEFSIHSSKEEKKFIDIVSRYQDQVVMAHDESLQEGFEYFRSNEYKDKEGSYDFGMKSRFMGGGGKKFFKMLDIFRNNVFSILKTRESDFQDLQPYIDELTSKGKIEASSKYKETYPNEKLWKEITDYAWNKWKVSIGFTELPRQFIFKGKAVLFKYVLVCIQEMEREKIDQAPNMEAGAEVFRVYNSLGIAVNDIARWIRAEYGLKCQSNHPLAGLVVTPPLAGKAGMGWQGCNGLLITPEYGQRQRIAPIFIERKLFEYTDSDEHRWIEDFCDLCKKCQRACPTKAIYEKRKLHLKNISGIGETKQCIDRDKCFPYFGETLGCSICVAVCPFSQGGDSYHKLKENFEKKSKNKS